MSFRPTTILEKTRNGRKYFTPAVQRRFIWRYWDTFSGWEDADGDAYELNFPTRDRAERFLELYFQHTKNETVYWAYQRFINVSNEFNFRHFNS